MITRSTKTFITLFFLISSMPAYSSQSKDVKLLVSANKLKSLGYADGYVGSVNVDLNGDGKADVIEYTYLNASPPGTCDQSDCMSDLSNSPLLTFQIKMHTGKTVDGSFMCTSLGVSKKTKNGINNLFCGPKYMLHWNGDTYDTN